MALQLCHRARPSYMEISNFFRLSRAATMGIGRQPRGFPSLRMAPQICRNISRGGTSIFQEEAGGGTDEMFESYKDSLIFPRATHEMSDLPKLAASSGIHVVLHGYLGTSVNMSKSMCVVPLVSKDLNHSIQIISSARSPAGQILSVHEKLNMLRPHTPVALTGILKKRKPPQGKNDDSLQKIDTVEVLISHVQSLNEFPPDIIATPDTVFPPEQRHLQIRTEKKLRNALAVRAKAASICRDELGEKQGFTEVETPLLFKSTPEGAREFIVPTRRKGLAYALPQSPQQFKQILMSSGISRYYQFAKCFRDEDLRADRQPEFTQLDLEMSFATGANVMDCIENLTRRLWKEVIGVDLPAPFPRMTYDEAMSIYGSDKPDLRLGMPISRVDHLLPGDLISKISPLANPIVEAIVFPSGELFDSEPPAAITRSFTKDFLDSPEAGPFHSNPFGGPGVFVFDPTQPLQGLHAFGFECAMSITSTLPLEPGDLLILQARPNATLTGSSTALGNLRLALHKAAVNAFLLPPRSDFSPIWITHFPLFTSTSESDSDADPNLQPLTSTHHPFTSPLNPNDVSVLSTNPQLALADHYDLVMNGVELGGGSRRIHHAALQSYILREVLRLPPDRLEEFSHLLEVLRAGCPPHAGFAIGFDRLVAVLMGHASVRDVIAFPKSGRGEDAMIRSPALISEDVLRTYHLKLR